MENLKQRVVEKINQFPHLPFDELWRQVLQQDPEIAEAMDNDQFAQFVVTKHQELSSPQEGDGVVGSGDGGGNSGQAGDLTEMLSQLPKYLETFNRVAETVNQQQEELNQLRQANAETAQLIQAFMENPEAVRQQFRHARAARIGEKPPQEEANTGGEQPVAGDGGQPTGAAGGITGLVSKLTGEQLDKLNELARNVAVIAQGSKSQPPDHQQVGVAIENEMRSMFRGVELISDLLGKFMSQMTNTYTQIQKQVQAQAGVAPRAGVDEEEIQGVVRKILDQELKVLAKKTSGKELGEGEDDEG